MNYYHPPLASTQPAAPLKGANHKRIVIEPKDLTMKEHAALIELLMPQHFQQIWVTRSTRRDVISPEAAAIPVELLRSLAQKSQETIEAENRRLGARHQYQIDQQVEIRKFFNASCCDAAMIWFDNALAVSTGQDGGVHIKLVESNEAQYACPQYVSNALFQGATAQATFELPPGTHTIAGDSGPAFTFTYQPSAALPNDAGTAHTCKVVVIRSTVYVFAGKNELVVVA